MPFNLLADPWLEVRRLSGKKDYISPCGLTDQFATDPVMALDFPRVDWNAAVSEFLIGLTFLAFPFLKREAGAWAEYFETPPTSAQLQEKWCPFLPSLNLDGEVPLAFQDFDPLEAQLPKPVSSLLIEAPGENTEKNNTDLFVKRGGVTALCQPYAAAALITLQTYAPSGGAGHRTSLRGGGPLTTLIAPLRLGQKMTRLWDKVWANIPYLENHDEKDLAAIQAQIFPWLQPTILSNKGVSISSDGRPLALAFFACPRRIRLVFTEGECSLTGQKGLVVENYRTQNYGGDYQCWQHPLSSYYHDKNNQFLPIHPHAGNSSYKDWLGWWGFNGTPAQSLKNWGSRKEEIEDILDVATPEKIEAFGYDMDNMKARQWLHAETPWLPDSHENLKESVKDFIDATDEAARAVLSTCRIALYGQEQKDGSYRIDSNAKESLKEASDQFWDITQPDFQQYLKVLKERSAQSGCLGINDIDLRQEWHKNLCQKAYSVFNAFVDVSSLTGQNPRRLVFAQDNLSKLLWLKVAQSALGLQSKQSGKSKRKAA